MKKALGILVSVMALATAFSAEAHRSWLKPSAAQVESQGAGKPVWVTIDGGVSETLFDFDSFPLKLDGLAITGPDGQPVQPDTPATGHLRSTFDLQLAKEGTYKVSIVTSAVMGSYSLNGETKRFRAGSDDEATKTVPAGATDVKTSHMNNRIETFVTLGKGNATGLAPSGKGLELVPVSHVDELVVDEPATFAFLLDGKPLASLAVTVIPGGARFRNALKEQALTTDDKGQIKVTWPMAGEYLVTASYPPRRQQAEGEGGGQGGPRPEGQGQGGQGQRGGQGGARMGGGGPGMDMQDRASYAATFIVLPN